MIIIIIVYKFLDEFLIKEINRCPAIILAVRRIVKVQGRIKFLIDSIRTIKGINILGVLWGIIWLNINLLFFNQLKVIILIHKGNDIDKEKIICLDLVKI